MFNWLKKLFNCGYELPAQKLNRNEDRVVWQKDEFAVVLLEPCKYIAMRKVGRKWVGISLMFNHWETIADILALCSYSTKEKAIQQCEYLRGPRELHERFQHVINTL